MGFIREQIIKRFTRSPKWSEKRASFLKSHNSCAVCSSKKTLEVHHIEDFHSNPVKELEDDNLITLCDGSTRCHFTFGHLGNFKSINPTIIEDAKMFSEKIRNRRK